MTMLKGPTKHHVSQYDVKVSGSCQKRKSLRFYASLSGHPKKLRFTYTVGTKKQDYCFMEQTHRTLYASSSKYWLGRSSLVNTYCIVKLSYSIPIALWNCVLKYMATVPEMRGIGRRHPGAWHLSLHSRLLRPNYRSTRTSLFLLSRRKNLTSSRVDGGTS